eukprot:717428-Pelagomonas_calceolata.AAC.1
MSAAKVEYAAVLLAAYVEPAKKGLHVQKEEEKGKFISLHSLKKYLLSAISRGASLIRAVAFSSRIKIFKRLWHQWES